MAGAQILCTKCGTVSAAPRLECAKCGGRNARVCAACGTQNSVAKNFCDKCGQSITALVAAAPPPAAKPPGAPAADIPTTAVYRLPTPGEAISPPKQPPPPFPSSGVPLPPAGGGPLPLPGGGMPSTPGQRPSEDPALGDLWAPQSEISMPTVEPLPPAAPAWKRTLNVVAASIGVLGAAFGIWRWQESQNPEILVPRLASQYLEALRLQDYDRAYSMFSEQARQSCTVDEFRAIRDTTPWTWSDLHIVHSEPGAILLAYKLQREDAEPRTDHVLFIQEGDRWARPYNWVLMRKVEESFEHGDADKGLLMAQVAATINPRDPMAWGYLCEAAYYRKSPQDAEMRCVKALELASTYPSNLTLKSIYHLHAILADTYNHALAKPDKALEQFGEMLAFQNISPEDQCQILLARAESYRRMSRPGQALADVERGALLCTSRSDLSYIQQMRDALRAPSP